MYETFIDLDELIVLCRDKSAKKFIQEAVDCYRAGAYRSCIVSTWNAVVFDFIHKLRQLEQVGNGEATQLLQDFANHSQNSEVRKLWEFESKIPDFALSKFELISPIEKADITRLFEDRSRCAHPSMASLDEPFEATAELARYHVRSAVTHLLQRPPVQGKAALDRIWQDIKSAYFPTDPNLAVKYFQKGHLARARRSLISSIVIGLTVSLLTEDFEDDERERQFSALNAVSIMYRREVREILNEKLSSIILDKVADKDFWKVVTYLRRVTAVENLSEPCRLKTIKLIQSINITKDINCQNEEILINAAHINFLMEFVKDKLGQAPVEEILRLRESLPDKIQTSVQDVLKEKIEVLIKAFIKSSNFYMANDYTFTIMQVSDLLTPIQKQNILEAFCNNSQIHGASRAPHLINYILEHDIHCSNSTPSYWQYFRKQIDKKFPNEFKTLKTCIDSYIENHQ
ncbi:MAG: hypothetical protein IM549_15110 [Pseudanabaena sp. M53BS1SP1A06MG]|nr:hypothetical protein [Pseudanabaena sp. M53BS1SP1A06MG]